MAHAETAVISVISRGPDIRCHSFPDGFECFSILTEDYLGCLVERREVRGVVKSPKHRVDGGMMRNYIALPCQSFLCFLWYIDFISSSCPGSKTHGFLHTGYIHTQHGSVETLCPRRLELPHLEGGKRFSEPATENYPHERHPAVGKIRRRDTAFSGTTLLAESSDTTLIQCDQLRCETSTRPTPRRLDFDTSLFR